MYIYKGVYLQGWIFTSVYIYKGVFLQGCIFTRVYIYKGVYLQGCIFSKEYIYKGVYLQGSIFTRVYIYKGVYFLENLWKSFPPHKFAQSSNFLGFHLLNWEKINDFLGENFWKSMKKMWYQIFQFFSLKPSNSFLWKKY